MCPREESFVHLYPHLGDQVALDKIRERFTSAVHCRWLRRDPNACNALHASEAVSGGHIPGATCPHNVYVHKQEVFDAREACGDTLERLFRLHNASEAHLLNEEDMDPLSVSELLATRNELQRQQNERERKAIEESRSEHESAQDISHLNL